MTRSVTLVGYAVIVTAMVGVQMAAVVTGRNATLSTVVRSLCRGRPGRVAWTLAWLWLGWHLFVRVDR